MTKILWLSHEVDLGGANKCLAEQIRILHAAGYHVEVIVLRDAIFADHIRPYTKGIHEIYFYAWVLDIGKTISAFRFWKRVFRNAIAVWKIWKLILRTRPDYVVTNTTTIPVAAIAAKLSARKHVWFLHEFGEEDHGYQMFCGFRKGAKLVNWLSSKLVFNSEALRRKYAPFVPAEKQFIAHNPVVIPADENYPEATWRDKQQGQPLECLILGQIAPSKNQLEALEAILQLKRQGVHLHLRMAGNVVNDQYEEQIKSFIRDNNLAQQAELMGYSDRPFDLLRQSDLYLMCSRMEAFGRVSVEALKLGVPVVASNTGGSPEIVEDGVNGFLYQAGNADDLAEKIAQFAARRDHFDHEDIARAANEKFNEAHTKRQLLEIFA
jgi:glycosyltransferase involved in cell wall biosynthesis